MSCLSDVRDLLKIPEQRIHRWLANGLVTGQPKKMGSGRARDFTDEQVVVLLALTDYHFAAGAGLDELRKVARIVERPFIARLGGFVYLYRRAEEPVLCEQKQPLLPRPGEALVSVRNHLPETWYKR